MSTALLSTKGQLVIPSRIRKALHLQPGDRVELELEGQSLVIRRVQSKRAKLVPGDFGRPVLKAGKGAPPMTPDRVKALLEDSP
jgi:AbrB family looped-hinge helix DNA binding protein